MGSAHESFDLSATSAVAMVVYTKPSFFMQSLLACCMRVLRMRVMSKVIPFSLVQNIYFLFYVIAAAMALVKRKIRAVARAMDLRLAISLLVN